jgi:TPR repeat protein
MFVRLIEDMAKRTMSVGTGTFSLLIDRHKEATGLMWGAETDLDQALAIYLENARAGYAGSMISLGDYYENGIDSAQSAPVATHFFTRAAERGQPSAYYGLARILAKEAQDRGIILEAAKFALLACRDLPEGQNRHGAEILKGQLLDKLNNDEQEMAVKLAGTWLPLTVEGGPIDAEPVLDYGRPSPSSTLN